MSEQSNKSSSDKKPSEPLIIDERARDRIREIAQGLFIGRSYSQFQAFNREECLFSALKTYLERHGVECKWEVENEF
jgi:hypothetical protein